MDVGWSRSGELASEGRASAQAARLPSPSNRHPETTPRTPGQRSRQPSARWSSSSSRNGQLEPSYRPPTPSAACSTSSASSSTRPSPWSCPRSPQSSNTARSRSRSCSPSWTTWSSQRGGPEGASRCSGKRAAATAGRHARGQRGQAQHRPRTRRSLSVCEGSSSSPPWTIRRRGALSDFPRDTAWSAYALTRVLSLDGFAACTRSSCSAHPTPAGITSSRSTRSGCTLQQSALPSRNGALTLLRPSERAFKALSTW